MGQPITVKNFVHSGRIALLLASIVAAASLGIAPVASEPFGSGDVSFVNIDSVEVELVITDNVNKDNEINKKRRRSRCRETARTVVTLTSAGRQLQKTPARQRWLCAKP